MSLFTPTPGFFYPPLPGFGIAVSFTNTSAADAAGEKICTFGRMWNKDGTAKSIRKVGFRVGTTLVSAGGSTIRCSLQNMATTGPPAAPDETQDQIVDFSITALAANTWYQTAVFSADRSVAFGELVAVVLEYQAFAGSDSFTLCGLTRSGAAFADFGASTSTKSGTWTLNTATGPVALLEFSDGTFGTLGVASMFTPLVSNVASSANAIHLTSATADERGNRILVPWDCYCDGAWVSYIPAAATSDLEIILYEGTTARKTATIDGGQLQAISGSAVMVSWTPQLMGAGEEWFIAMRPTVSGVGSQISPQSFTVADANHFQCHPCGTSVYSASRLDLGAWSAVTTTRLLAGLSISSIDVESSGGGGGGATLSRIQGGF